MDSPSKRRKLNIYQQAAFLDSKLEIPGITNIIFHKKTFLDKLKEVNFERETNSVTLYGLVYDEAVKSAGRWLRAQQIEHDVFDIRKRDIPRETIQEWVDLAGWKGILNERARSWISLSEEQKLEFTDENIIDKILQDLTLLKRPVLVTRNFCVFGQQDSKYEECFLGEEQEDNDEE